ncbi:MAG TPA: hypothetical protein VLL51_11645, partial [Gemmatimonadales bacterium]|nr:hypothetical protein [Gemmatimonadales bacterium]
MRRRAFVSLAGAALLPGRWWRQGASSLLVPMDETQTDHLKAYGVAFRAIARGDRAEWLLNYRGGSFLLPATLEAARDATLSGVVSGPVDDARVTAIRAEIQQSNADAV